jgi:predicted O-methyltransferase YrrM
MGVMSGLRSAGKRALRGLFEAGQRLGFDVLPRHFYSEVPDIARLRAERGWRRPYSMAGVAGADPVSQFAFVDECCPPALRGELAARDLHAEACAANGAPGYGRVEADFLWCFMRSKRPRRVVQVGCGVSTAVLLAAASADYVPEILCIDPYPTRFLEEAAAEGRIRLVRERAEDAPVSTFASLGAGDFLFVDSTHTLVPGGEVPRIVLEALPVLAAGVWAHFHDVYFPYDYARGLLDDDLFFPHESVLLHAFLAMNASFAVRASLSMLHYADPSGLKARLGRYRPCPNDDGLRAGVGDFPSSLYIQRVH